MKGDLDKLPGLKRREITACAICGKGLSDGGSIAFYRVKLERYVLMLDAIRRRAGLEAHFGGGHGGAALAEAMGPDDDLAKQVGDTAVAIVCDACAMDPSKPLAAINQRIDAARGKEPSAMADLQRHPILRAIYDVMRAIERCGASPELTEAVVLAGRLSEQAATILDELDEARAELAREREESRGWIVLGMNAEAELARVREALQPARDALAAIDSSTDEARQRTGRMAEDACFYAAQRALMALDAARGKEAAERDAELLDWLSTHPREATIRIGGDMQPAIFWGISAAPGTDMRAAIDAARAEDER